MKTAVSAALVLLLAAALFAGAASATALPTSGTVSPGTYELTADVQLTNQLTINSGEVTVDLNGHSITAASKKRLFYVSDGATFTLKDSSVGKNGKLIGNGTLKEWGGGVYVYGGSFNMEGGNITGCTCDGNDEKNAGAVYVTNAGSFAMKGGVISNCSAREGGGVYVTGSSSFTMSDGSITGCYSNYHNVMYSYGYSGGGVYVEESTFTMNGGSISNCRAAVGGGVSTATKATFNINGGTITDCNQGSTYYGYGSSVCSYSGGYINIGAANIVLVGVELQKGYYGCPQIVIINPAAFTGQLSKIKTNLFGSEVVVVNGNLVQNPASQFTLISGNEQPYLIPSADGKDLVLGSTDKFSVAVNYVGNGTAALNPPSITQYKFGSVVNLTVTPEPGYMLGNWDSNYTVQFISESQFIMPGHDLLITAHFVRDTTGIGRGEYILANLGEGASNVKVYYDEVRKTIFVEKVNPAAPATLGDGVLTITQFGFSDAEVKLVEISCDVGLGTNPNAFSLFTNAGINYLGDSIPGGFNIGRKPVYSINATNSSVYIEATGRYTGMALTVDTNFAVPDQKVRIAVKPENGYAVYDWKLHRGEYKTENLITPVGDYITRTDDPEYGPTVYILTMPNSAVTVEPVLRDQGSTIVVYLFIDADSYVLEIPADFNIKKQDLPVTDKIVNLTACDMLSGHVLNVNMTSEGGYTNLALPGFSGSTFVMSNIRSSADKAGYTIAKKQIYNGDTSFAPITNNGDIVLSTDGFDAESLEDKLMEGNMKTELEFTLKGVKNPNALGKYKDKLTFTVEIES